MRKLILIGLASLILMGTAILSIVWFSRASAVKKDVESYIESLNTNNLKFTYEEIRTSGFPLSMNVSIVNPHVTGQMNKFMQDVGLDKVFNMTNLPEWNEDYSLNGSINLIANALSNKFRIETHGEMVGKGSVAGKSISILSQPNGGSVCELQLFNDNLLLGNMWDFYLLQDDKTKLAQSFRSFDCVIPATKIVNSETKEPIISYNSSRFFISRAPEQDHANIRLYMMFKDVEATKSYDEIYNLYASSLSPEITAVMPSYYGKQNTEIDIFYSGTENWSNLQQALNTPFSLKVNKFLVSNNAYQADTSASFAHSIKDGMRNASFTYKTEATATELLRSILHTQFHNFIGQIKKGSSEYAQDTKVKLINMSVEDTNKMLYSIIPDFTAIGKITTKIDANYAGSDDMKNFNADLKAFDFSLAPYGVTSTGSVKMEPSNPLPVGNLSITCSNCSNMLDDLASYVERLQYALSIFYPNNASPVSGITSDSVRSFKNFILALAPADTAENKGTVKLDVINDGKGAVSVNGKSSEEVLALYNKFMMPGAASVSSPSPKMTAPGR